MPNIINKTRMSNTITSKVKRQVFKTASNTTVMEFNNLGVMMGRPFTTKENGVLVPTNASSYSIVTKTKAGP